MDITIRRPLRHTCIILLVTKVAIFIVCTNFKFYFTSEKILMIHFLNRFIYNDDADSGAGGAVDTSGVVNEIGKPAEDNAPDPAAPAAAVIPDDIRSELEQLRAFKAANTKAPEKSPEELERENERDRAEFIKYSVDNDLFKIDELTQYESLKVKADADLVFESFVKDFKEENPDIEDEEELSEAAKEEFEKIYKISSDNEKIKEKGLAKLARDAKEIRSPYESKIQTAETNYKEEKQVRQKMPDFDKFIDSQIKKNAPDKFSIKVKAGDTDVPVEIELTAEDREAIAKEFKTPKTFYSFNKSVEETEKALDKKIQGWVKVNKMEQIVSKAFEIGEGLGVRGGSNTGADAPFALRQGQPRMTAKVLTLEDSNAKIAEARSRVN